MPQTTVLDYKEAELTTKAKDVGTHLRISSHACRSILYLNFCLEVDGTLRVYRI